MAKARSSIGEILDLLVAGYDISFEYSPRARAIEIRVTTSRRARSDEPQKGMVQFVDESELLTFIEPDQLLALTLERIKRQLDRCAFHAAPAQRDPVETADQIPAQHKKATDGQTIKRHAPGFSVR